MNIININPNFMLNLNFSGKGLKYIIIFNPYKKP